MASSPTSSLLAEKQGSGDNPGAWDTHLNGALDVFDSAIAGTTSVSTTGGSTTLDDANYTNDDAKKAVLDITGALTTNATIVIPNRSKTYRVFNRTTEGGSNTTVTVKTSAGSGITVTRDTVALIYCDGNDVVRYGGAMTVISSGSVSGTLVPADIGVTVQAWDTQLDSLSSASANGVSLVTAADYAAMKALLDLEIGTDVQAYDATLTTYAGIDPSANVQSVLGAADYSAIRTLLGLVIGTNVQAYDATLTTYAGIDPSANVQSILGAADYSAVRTLLGLVIGTNVQAYDADLTTWAGLTPSANAQSLVTAADYAAMRALLDLEIGTDVQAYDVELAAIAGLTSAADKVPYFTGSGTAAVADFTASGRAMVAAASAAAQTALLSDVVGDSGSGGTKGLVPAPASGDAAASKFLKADGTWTAIPGGGDALKADPLSQFAATTSAQLAGVISDETGSGALVFATSPTLVTPDIGTPSSGTLTNCTGLPTILAANEATDTTCFIGFFTAASGELGAKTNANLTFNSNTGVLTSASSVLTTTDINGGTIDGAVIGASSAAAGTFTNGTATNFASGYTTTATAAGTTTLTVTSNRFQFFTGSTTQTVTLPVTSTLTTGFKFTIVNNSTGVVTVQSSGANNVLVMGPGSTADFVCILTSGTTAASWSVLTAYAVTPQNSQSAAYTTVLSDAGKHLLHPTADNNARTFTIDSNANVPYPIGTMLMFINQINVVTIAITSDTLTWAPTGGTGSRNLAANGVALAVKIASTSWVLYGVGLS